MPFPAPMPRACLLFAILLSGVQPQLALAQLAPLSSPMGGPVYAVPTTQPTQVTPLQQTVPAPLGTPSLPASKPAQITPIQPGTPAQIAPVEIPAPAGEGIYQAVPDEENEPTGPDTESPARKKQQEKEQQEEEQSEEQAGDQSVDRLPPRENKDIKSLEQNPVQLFDEEKLSKGRTLLNSVLTASVVKVQEYPVDLPTVLKLVEAQNLFLQDYNLNAKIQNNLFYRSLSDLLPDVVGTYNQSRFQGSIQVFGSQTVQVYQSRIVPQATASWTINPAGRDVFTVLAAKQRAREAKFLLNQTLQDQLTQATVEYYELIAAGVNVANIKANIQEVQSQVALNEARLKAGVGTKLDLERAKSLLIEREQELITAENNLAKAQQNLLSRLNLDPEVALVPPQVNAIPRILIPLTTSTDQLVDRAIANNPSLKVIQQEIRAINYQGKAVLADMVPSVTLQAYINGTGPQIDMLGLGRFGGFAIQSNLFNNLGTGIPLDYRTFRLQAAQQKVRLKEQMRTVQTSVINAFLDSRAGVQSLFTAQEQLDVAEEAYRLSFGRYKAGLGINVDVLNAQTALALARVRVVRAIFDFNEAQVQLLQAIGEVSTHNILNGMKASEFTQTPKSAK